MAPLYYRDAAAAIVVYDITSDESFQSVKSWVKEVNQLGPKNIILAIVGNKHDYGHVGVSSFLTIFAFYSEDTHS